MMAKTADEVCVMQLTYFPKIYKNNPKNRNEMQSNIRYVIILCSKYNGG